MLCPNCHQPVETGAQFCGNCGTRLTPAEPAGQPIVTQAQSQQPAYTAPAPTQPVVAQAQNPQPPYPVQAAVPAAVPAQDHSGKAVASFVLGVLGLPACLIPIVGLVFGILAIIFGTLSVRSARKVLAIIGMALGVLVVLVSLLVWVSNTQRLLREHTNNNSLTTQGTGKLQTIATPCYTTKIPADMHVTHTATSCTFLGATTGGKEQEEVKVIQVPGLTQSNLATAATADAANVVGSIPGGSIKTQGAATFAGSQAYQIEIASTDGSAGVISYVYNTTAQGNLVIVLHTQAEASNDNYNLHSIESSWAWL